MKKTAIFAFILVAPYWSFLALSCSTVRAINSKPLEAEAAPTADASTLDGIILTLPPEYFSNCPYADRQQMLRELTIQNEGRLDVMRGWLHYYSDGGMVRADSIIRLKTFHSNALGTVVFVHMMKPYNGAAPSPQHTRVLIINCDQKWQDITNQVIPAEADLNWHFSPRLKYNIIEVGPWIGTIPKRCVGELEWAKDHFQFKQVMSRPFWDDISNKPLWP